MPEVARETIRVKHLVGAWHTRDTLSGLFTFSQSWSLCMVGASWLGTEDIEI